MQKCIYCREGNYEELILTSKSQFLNLSKGKNTIVYSCDYCGNVQFFNPDKKDNLEKAITNKKTLSKNQITTSLNIKSIKERIKIFKGDRLYDIQANRTPVKLAGNDRTILHLIPSDAFNTNKEYDFKKILNQLQPLTQTQGYIHTEYNAEGIYNYAEGNNKDSHDSYVQLYRNGIIETIDIRLLKKYRNRYLHLLPHTLIDTTKRYLDILRTLGVGLPIFLLLTLENIRGAAYSLTYNKIIDRDSLELPEVIIDRFDIEPTKILKPCFDILWNACGFERCPFYDKDGNWIG